MLLLEVIGFAPKERILTFRFNLLNIFRPEVALLLLVTGLFAPQGAQAQYAAPAAPTVHATAEQILAALLPKEEATRGIKRDQTGFAPPTDAPKATILVSFDEETNWLSVEGMKTLRELSVALMDPKLQNSAFQIAAHGYAAGDPQLQVKTARRAQMISEHLAAFYAIDVSRLQPIGVGAQNVLNLNAPEDPINFRIEVFNLPRG